MSSKSPNNIRRISKSGMICLGLVISCCVIGIYGFRLANQEQKPEAELPSVELSEEIIEKPTIRPPDSRDLFAEPIDPVLLATHVLELIRIEKDSDVQDFFKKVDDRLLGGDEKIRKRRIGEFMRGLKKPPARLYEQPDVSLREEPRRLEDRRLVHLAVKFYSRLLDAPDALLPTASHMAGFQSDFIKAANGFEYDGMKKKLHAAMYKPTPLQFTQLSRLSSIPDLPKWNVPFYECSASWVELLDDPRDAGRRLVRLLIHSSQYKDPELPVRIPLHWITNNRKQMLNQHGLTSAARVLAGFAEVDPTFLNGESYHLYESEDLRKAWRQRWNRMWIRRSDDLQAIGWKEVFADYIEGVVKELNPDEMRFVTPGLYDVLSEQRKRMIGQGYDPREDPEYVHALKKLAVTYPQLRILVARVCMDVRKFKYTSHSRPTRKSSQNKHAIPALGEDEMVAIVIQLIREEKYWIADSFLLQVDRKYLGQTMDQKYSRFTRVMKGFDLPVAKPSLDRSAKDVILSIADRLRGVRKSKVPERSVEDTMLSEWKDAAIAYRVYERLLNEPDALLPTALHMTKSMPKVISVNSEYTEGTLWPLLKNALKNPTETQFQQLRDVLFIDKLLRFNHGYTLFRFRVGTKWLEHIEENPRLAGYCLGHINRNFSVNNPNLMSTSSKHQTLNDLISSVSTRVGIVQSAEFIAGLVKAEPTQKSQLKHLLRRAWSHRWQTMMAARGGFTADMPWKEILDEYITDVAKKLKPEEQWYASLGLNGALSSIRHQMYDPRRKLFKSLEYYSALRDSVEPFPAFKVACERMILGYSYASVPKEKRKPLEIHPCLQGFLISEDAPSRLRLDFAETLVKDDVQFTEGAISSLNIGIAKAYRDWVKEGGRFDKSELISDLVRSGKRGPEWNPARIAIGKFLIEVSENTNTQEEDVSKLAKKMALDLTD